MSKLQPMSVSTIVQCRNTLQSWTVPADEVPEEFFQFGFIGVYEGEYLQKPYQLRSYPSINFQSYVLGLYAYLVAFLDVYKNGLLIPCVVWEEKMPKIWRELNLL